MMKKYTRTTTILSTIITIIEMTKIMVDLTNKYNLTDYTSYPTIYILISEMNRDTMLKSILVIVFQCSIPHEFKGEYVRLQNNPKWKKIAVETNDQHLVFADIITKVNRKNGKVSNIFGNGCILLTRNLSVCVYVNVFRVLYGVSKAASGSGPILCIMFASRLTNC